MVEELVTISLSSLFDPPNVAVLTPAAAWVEALLTGTLAAAVAVLAIAWIGLLMLRGRVNLRRGAVVLFGCFVLFGARTIAEGLFVRGAAVPEIAEQSALQQVPLPALDPIANSALSYDPYAGAAVPR